MAPRITAKQAEFVESMGLFGVASGISRSTSRVLGFLMICEPTYQSAAEVQATLQLSSGAVSSALLLLRQAGLIKRRTFPGDRHYYYEMEPNSWRHVVLRRLETFHRAVELAESGLLASPGNPRLIDMRDVYAIFEAEVERMKKRLA